MSNATEYARPDVLVSTEWVEAHRNDADVVVAEVSVTPGAYDEGHVPGAVGWDWTTDLCDPVNRDIASKDAVEQLLGAAGVTPDSTIVLYGDYHNWFAAWGFWLLKVYGHADVRLMDGGRDKWLQEDRPLSIESPSPQPATYQAREADSALRSFYADVLAQTSSNGDRTGGDIIELVDVRSPAEFSGEKLAPEGVDESCQRGGHIPGASNIPWSENVSDHDGTFKPAGTLRQIYRDAGITGERPIVTYCRIGERSSHSWFVLKYLLGFDDVRNYDGSWTEWGNAVRAPIERGAATS